MNTKFSDLISYFATLAAQHVDICHRENEKHFYRFELEEVLTNLKNVHYPALILEGYRYSLSDKQSDNVLKERSGAFCLIDHLKDVGDFDSMHQVWDNMESICDDLVARIRTDKRNPAIQVIKGIDLNSLQVALIANTTDNNYGIRCTFTVISPLSVDVDSTKWDFNVSL